MSFFRDRYNYQRIVRFVELKPGERFACSTTGIVYHKIDEDFGEDEDGGKFEIFQPDKLVYTDVPERYSSEINAMFSAIYGVALHRTHE